MGYFISSLEGRSVPPPFELVEVDNLITPSTDEIYRDLSPALTRPSFDVAKDMITVAEHQRCHAVERRGVDQVPVSLVGGFLQLTTIAGPSDVRSRIIHRWHDHIGQTILESMASSAACA